jgi:hypothetical protein
MRTLLFIPALTLAATLGGRASVAQRVERAVTVSVTVTVPLQARVDVAAATLRAAGDGMQLTVPLRTWGAISPIVAVRHGGGETACETAASTPGAAARRAGDGTVVLCALPRPTTEARVVDETLVTLVVSTVN